MFIALLWVLAAGPAPAPKPMVVPTIDEAWVDRFDRCDGLRKSTPLPGESVADSLRRAEQADKAFTDEVAKSCGFDSREHFERFGTRVGAALAEASERVTAALVSPDFLKGKDAAIERRRKELKAGTITKDEFDLYKANVDQAVRVVKAQQARDARRKNKPLPHLDAEVVLVAIRDNPTVLVNFERMVRERQITTAQKKQMLDELAATAKLVDRYAREQAPLAAEEVAAMEQRLRKAMEAARGQ